LEAHHSQLLKVVNNLNRSSTRKASTECCPKSRTQKAASAAREGECRRCHIRWRRWWWWRWRWGSS